jgi:subfamily B ATP-binding cassette protein MsbA
MFWTYLLMNRSWLLLMAVFMAISALCSGALTLSIKPAFDSILTRSVAWTQVYIFLGSIMLIFVGKGIGQFGERLCVARIVTVTIDRLQKRLMSDVLHKPFVFFQTISSGELTARIGGDLSQIRQHLVNVVLVVGKESVTAVVLFGVLLWMDFRLSLMLLTIAVVMAWPLALLTKRMRRMTTLAQTQSGHITGQLGALFNFVKTIKACGAEDFENQRFKATTRAASKYWMQAFWFYAWNFPLMEIGAGLILIGILAYGVLAIKLGSMTIGSLLGFLGTLLFLYESIKRLLYASGPIQEIQTILARTQVLLSPSLPEDIRPTFLFSVPCSISCHNVSFDGILSPINLEIPAGKRVVIMGKSGGGKTTLCDLLVGFYAPTSGTISINDRDLLAFKAGDLCQMIAYLPQETAVFERSVLSNLWTNDNDKAMQMLMDLELKHLATATTLSGGELRRLALCRTLLRDCSIYILDEPLSGLDMATKKIAMGLIDRITKGKTTVIVSHEPIDFVDSVYTI